MEGILQQNPEGCDLLQCPECNKEHAAPKRAKSFIQNKYILPFIKRKPKLCEIHGREIVFYCNDAKCKTSICTRCMFEEHREHNFVDLAELQEERTKIVTSRNEAHKKITRALKEDLQLDKEKLAEIITDFTLKADACEADMRSQKKKKIEEVTRVISNGFDEMIESVKDKNRKELANISQNVATINRYISELDDVKEPTDMEEINFERQKIKNVISQLDPFTGRKYYRNVKLVGTAVPPVKDLCGKIDEETNSVKLLETLERHISASRLHLNGQSKIVFNISRLFHLFRNNHNTQGSGTEPSTESIG